MPELELNARQLAFIEEYLKDRNGTQAAIRAGYAENGASTHATRMLANARIYAAIQARVQTVTQANDVSADKILKELAKGAFADLPIEKMTFSDKLKALEILCKYLGLLDGSGADTKGKNKGAISAAILGIIDRVKTKAENG